MEKTRHQREGDAGEPGRGHIVLAIMLVLPCAAWAGPQGHSTNDESAVYTCRIGTRAASVCAARDLSGNRHVQYRFGRIGQQEIVLPRNGKHRSPPDALVYINQIGDGEGYIRFRSDAYSYVIYHFSSQDMPVAPGLARGWRNRNGVLVEKGGGTVSHLRCDPGRGVVVNFDPAMVYTTLGLTESSSGPAEDPLLRKLDQLVAQ